MTTKTKGGRGNVLAGGEVGEGHFVVTAYSEK
jgi:hypothetical protein